MLRLLAVFAFGLLAFVSVPSQAQAPASGPSGSAILAQSLNTSGVGLNASLAFTASGTITYFWGGEQVQGAATLRARGHDQFRMDANLPEGTRSHAVNRRSGARKEANGKRTEIPYHNTLGMGVPSLPYASMASALADPAFTVSYEGLMECGSRQCHQVRVMKTLPQDRDPDGLLGELSRTDYFVDAQTFLVSKTEDLTHPVETATEHYSHEVEFESYAAQNGIAVPKTIREKIGGQATWEFHLSTITFNSSLSDGDFSLP